MGGTLTGGNATAAATTGTSGVTAAPTRTGDLGTTTATTTRTSGTGHRRGSTGKTTVTGLGDGDSIARIHHHHGGTLTGEGTLTRRPEDWR